jgi:nitroimidazol reductase NimA-like FMN-containing flavoprotein (pyridoxamine 5'-phosphate oxidase superfamily)
MTHWELRKKDQEITSDKEMRDILRQAKYVTMAMCLDNEPYLVTVSHGYDADQNTIYFHCAHEGRKIDILKENPKVWGEAIVDGGTKPEECGQDYETTQFHGVVSFPQEMEEKRHGLSVLIAQFGADVDKFFAKEDVDKRIEKVNIGRVDIDFLSGKRSSED